MYRDIDIMFESTCGCRQGQDWGGGGGGQKTKFWKILEISYFCNVAAFHLRCQMTDLC